MCRRRWWLTGPHLFVTFPDGHVWKSTALKDASICFTKIRVMAGHWCKSSVRKCLTLDKHSVSSLTTHTHTHAPSDFSSETEDKCNFSRPLLHFSILFTTLSSLKEKFICHLKSHRHQEVIQWLVRDETARTGHLPNIFVICSPACTAADIYFYLVVNSSG